MTDGGLMFEAPGSIYHHRVLEESSVVTSATHHHRALLITQTKPPHSHEPPLESFVVTSTTHHVVWSLHDIHIHGHRVEKVGFKAFVKISTTTPSISDPVAQTCANCTTGGFM